MKQIATAISRVLENPRQRVPTLWELTQEYPRLVIGVITNPAKPSISLAEVQVPYGGDTLQLMRSIRGARWNKTNKTWQVPGFSARRLSEVLYLIAGR